MITKQFANKYGWSDVSPFEIVKVISDQTIEVRELDAKRDESWVPNFIPGGFSAVCVNDREQKWKISSNPENKVFRIRFSKRKNVWQDAYGGKYDLSDTPIKYYDFNF